MLINVDAGHGSNTAGKRTPPMPMDIDINGDGVGGIKKGEQYREHYANVGVCSYLVKELERCGFKTMRTGWNDDNPYDDSDTPLVDRQKAIAKAGCDYSISIHFNAFGDGYTFNSAEGVGIYIHDKHQGTSKKLAEMVLKHLAGGSKQKNRGITPASLAMCNCNNMDVKAAILVELAFMTNYRESTELMANKSYWYESAVEICKGLCEYTGVKYIPENYKPTKSITVDSAARDIKWAQEQLNAVLPEWFPKIPVNGVYDSATRIAVLLYWEMLGWGKHMNDDGKRIGSATLEALSTKRTA